MDDQSIDRIIAATRAAPRADKVETLNIDSVELHNDIESVCDIRDWAGVERHRDALHRLRCKILEKSRELGRLLEKERAEDGKIGMFYSPSLSDYVKVLHAVKRATEQAVKPQAPSHKEDERIGEMLHQALTSGSLFEVAISRLIFIFEKHFKSSAGFTKPTDGSSPADGPFIRFADAALWELGITKPGGERYSSNYIADSLTDVRNGGRHIDDCRLVGATGK